MTSISASIGCVLFNEHKMGCGFFWLNNEMEMISEILDMVLQTFFLENKF